MTNASKTDMIEALSLAFERSAIEILNDPVLIAELQAFESKRLPSGLTRYSAPEGMHDDCVIALALAYQAAESVTGTQPATVQKPSIWTGATSNGGSRWRT